MAFLCEEYFDRQHKTNPKIHQTEIADNANPNRYIKYLVYPTEDAIAEARSELYLKEYSKFLLKLEYILNNSIFIKTWCYADDEHPLTTITREDFIKEQEDTFIDNIRRYEEDGVSYLKEFPSLRIRFRLNKPNYTTEKTFQAFRSLIEQLFRIGEALNSGSIYFRRITFNGDSPQQLGTGILRIDKINSMFEDLFEEHYPDDITNNLDKYPAKYKMSINNSMIHMGDYFKAGDILYYDDNTKRLSNRDKTDYGKPNEAIAIFVRSDLADSQRGYFIGLKYLSLKTPIEGTTKTETMPFGYMKGCVIDKSLSHGPYGKTHVLWAYVSMNTNSNRHICGYNNNNQPLDPNGIFPCANACWLYSPFGTFKGSWYLPDFNDIVYIRTHLKEINKGRQQLSLPPLKSLSKLWTADYDYKLVITSTKDYERNESTENMKCAAIPMLCVDLTN